MLPHTITPSINTCIRHHGTFTDTSLNAAEREVYEGKIEQMRDLYLKERQERLRLEALLYEIQEKLNGGIPVTQKVIPAPTTEITGVISVITEYMPAVDVIEAIDAKTQRAINESRKSEQERQDLIMARQLQDEGPAEVVRGDLSAEDEFKFAVNESLDSASLDLIKKMRELGEIY